MRIDTEELLIALQEKGIDVSISLNNTQCVLELTNIDGNTLIGVARGETVETALAQIIKRLAESKNQLNTLMSKPDRLSIL